MRPAGEVGRRGRTRRSRLCEPGGDEATAARNVVALHAAYKFGDAQGPRLGGSEPQQLLADPATTELATNVDRGSCSFTIDLDVVETDGLVVQQADPSVAGRVLPDEQPPLQAGSVEVGVEASLPCLVLCEPAGDECRKNPSLAPQRHGPRRRSHRHRLLAPSAERSDRGYETRGSSSKDMPLGPGVR
jgi:hypothetical protein